MECPGMPAETGRGPPPPEGGGWLVGSILSKDGPVLVFRQQTAVRHNGILPRGWVWVPWSSPVQSACL